MGVWGRGAAAWQSFVRSGADYYRDHVRGPGLLGVTAVRAGERVLDVGCGEGYFARELAKRGAAVTAIDLSPALIAMARAAEECAPLGIEYRVMSADTAVREGRKLALRIDGYFDSGPTRSDWNMPRLAYRWQTPCWRRTLSEWSSMISAAGFVIGGLHEPRPTATQVEAVPALEDCSRAAYVLVFDLLKRSATRTDDRTSENG